MLRNGLFAYVWKIFFNPQTTRNLQFNNISNSMAIAMAQLWFWYASLINLLFQWWVLLQNYWIVLYKTQYWIAASAVLPHIQYEMKIYLSLGPVSGRLDLAGTNGLLARTLGNWALNVARSFTFLTSSSLYT